MPPVKKAAAKADPEPVLSLIEQLAQDAQGKSLRYRIALIQHHVGHVEKSGQVSFGDTNFKHMQEHGLIAELRPLCRAVGVGYYGGVPEAGGWSQDGNRSIVDFALTVFNVDTGEEIVRYFPNIGVDRNDKGFNKAYTGAMKYALQKFFAVPTEDIDDNETIDTPAMSAAAEAEAARQADRPGAKDLKDLRDTLGDQSGEFIKRAQNKVKTYGVDRMDEMTAAQFLEFGQWVEHQIADAQAASE